MFALEAAIQSDESSIVAKIIKTSLVNDALASSSEAILDHLIELSIMHRSKSSTQSVLTEAFPASGLMADHNLLNRIITRVGEEDMLHDNAEPIQSRRFFCEIAVSLAIEITCRSEKNIVMAVDDLGRLITHYSA